MGEKARAEPWKNQYLCAWRETERGCQDAEKREAREQGKDWVRKGVRGRLAETDKVGGWRIKDWEEAIGLIWETIVSSL